MEENLKIETQISSEIKVGDTVVVTLETEVTKVDEKHGFVRISYGGMWIPIENVTKKEKPDARRD